MKDQAFILKFNSAHIGYQAQACKINDTYTQTKVPISARILFKSKDMDFFIFRLLMSTICDE